MWSTPCRTVSSPACPQLENSTISDSLLWLAQLTLLEECHLHYQRLLPKWAAKGANQNTRLGISHSLPYQIFKQPCKLRPCCPHLIVEDTEVKELAQALTNRSSQI